MALVRWVARIHSGVVVLFFGFFLVAHLIGEQGQASRPLVWADYVILATLAVSLVGLLLAWKWEFAGAAITLIAILACAVVNWEDSGFPRRTHPDQRRPLSVILHSLCLLGRRCFCFPR